MFKLIIGAIAATLTFCAILVAVTYLSPPSLPQLSPLPPCENLVSGSTPSTPAACKNAYTAQIKLQRAVYDRWKLELHMRSFTWQAMTNYAWFAISIIILCFGFVLTWLEFHQKREHPTVIKAGATGIEVSSEVIGIIVLVLALSFSYLYLEKAYPIEVINTDGQSKNPDPDASSSTPATSFRTNSERGDHFGLTGERRILALGLKHNQITTCAARATTERKLLTHLS